jgi:glycosyltransferase involved in cell wall biosynthesis
MARMRALGLFPLEAIKEPIAQPRDQVSTSPERSRLPSRAQLVRPRITAGIPCYNEERFIGDLVLQTRRLVDQVIVVDDGSQDGTSSAAKAAGALVVDHGSNKGYGEAIRSCFQAARNTDTDILVTLDGDNQHTPEEITMLTGPIARGEADIVIGSRLLKQSPQTNMRLYRRFGIRMITWLCNVGSPVKVTDSQSGFRAYRRSVLESVTLTDPRMGASVEMLIKARKKGFVITEVPITCRYHSESSEQNPVSHGLGVVLAVIMFRLRNMWPANGASDGSGIRGNGQDAVSQQSASR